MMDDRHPDILIVGLGPGAPLYRTVAARAALEESRVLFLRSADHPGMDDLVARPGTVILDRKVADIPGGGKDWAAAATILCDTAAKEPVVLSVPGHPRFGERLVIESLAEAGRRDLSVEIIDGLSAIDLIATSLNIDPVVDDVQIIDAAQVVRKIDDGPFNGGLFPFTPLRPMLFSRVYGNPVARPLSAILQRLFPADHPATIVTAAGIPESARTETTTIAGLAETDPDRFSSLWIPALPEMEAYRDPRTQQHITALLRAPGGCPWDRKQTHASLRDTILDEAYEVVDAIDSGDIANLAEELGDLFLLICLHAQIAEENGEFTLEDVYEGIATKIIRRHPHVFGDATAESPDELAAIWAGVKAQEKREEPAKPDKAADGQPHSMPALVRAPRVLAKHPVNAAPTGSTPDARSRALLDAVAAIVAAGDDPDQVLRDALVDHVTNKTGMPRT
ncbi:MAG TPA: MazG family protein [Thermomicrobiales bacterium]|nr:MazG family protein [Thermomicrobiales bacterium]